ncbi:hypothetical protein A0128_01290 [Leptospira tipperaryensis]|uniref:DUF3293 domain-containing protein n=1 Tax=Leptospira tipperaryensis TaxID=2564040 RepID=A0A1D7V1W9_9LEPT|nr:hypothetical protein A0128_01290 [Leptospira tipperaryensis]
MDSYLKTRYLVFEPNLSIFAESFNPTLDRFLKEHGKKEWAYLTAFNPRSEVISSEKNRRRNDELKQELDGYSIFEGEGKGDDPDWIPESSFLVLGISERKAILLGKKFQQNAILIGRIGCRSKLKFLY